MAIVRNAKPKGKVKSLKKRVGPNKYDPSRTLTLRRSFAAHIKKQFGKLKKKVVHLIAVEDALGLKQRKPFTVNLDRQGGEEPSISAIALRQADFITYPEDVKGSNCGNCEYQKGGICRHPSLDGQPVNERNCCAYWNSPGTFRGWKQTTNLYQPFLCVNSSNRKEEQNLLESSVGWFPARGLLDLEDVRQPTHFECGSAATKSAFEYVGAPVRPLSWWTKKLGTDAKQSTQPQAIIDLGHELGLQIEAKQDMSIDDLRQCIARGWPVLVPFQDYGPYLPKAAEYKYGHWAAVVYVADGYIFLQDPSASNVAEEAGSIQAPGRIMVTEEDWLKNWHDKDVDGNEYDHFGIAVGPAVVGNAFCATGEGGGIDPTCSPKGAAHEGEGERGTGVPAGARPAGGLGEPAGSDVAQGGQSAVGPLTDQWLSKRTADGEFTPGFAEGFRRAIRNSPPAVGQWFEQGRPNGWPVVVERDVEEEGLPPSVKAALHQAQAITVNGFRIEYAKDPTGMGGRINDENLTHELTHTAFNSLLKKAQPEVQEAIDEATHKGDAIVKMAFSKKWFTKNPPTNDEDYDTWRGLGDVRRMATSVKRYVRDGRSDVTGSLELSLAIPPYRFSEMGKYGGGRDTSEAGDQWHVVATYSALCKKYGTRVDPVYQGEELVTYKAGKDKAYAQRLFSKLLDKPTANVEDFERILAVDYDGTITDKPGRHDLYEVEPRDGVREKLTQAKRAGLKVVIYTGNDDHDGIRAWLDKYDIPFDEIRAKMRAAAYIDDRSIEAAPDDSWDDIFEQAMEKVYGEARQPLEEFDGYPELRELAVTHGQQEMESLLAKLNFRTVNYEEMDFGHLEAELVKPGPLVILAPIKREGRATEKVQADYEGDWSRLLDMVRSAVCCDSLDELRLAAGRLISVGAVTARLPKDRFKEPEATGYRDYLVNYVLPSGMICEVQFHLKPMFIAREKDWISHDVIRAIKASMEEEDREDMTPGEAEAVRRAKDGSKRLYAKAWEQANGTPTSNKRWSFNSDPEQLQAFQEWLKTQLNEDVDSPSEEQLWQKYIQQGFEQGAKRSFDDVRGSERFQQEPGVWGMTREEFLKTAFAQPQRVERLKLLAARTFTDLKGVTSWMATTMGRVLADGLVEGNGPREIARDLAKQVDIGRQRALLIARTEIIRAHAQGQLRALEALGVDEIGVMVEWSITNSPEGDGRVCPECEDMDGETFTIEEAEGLIPAHPQCLPGDSLVLARDGITATSKRWCDCDLVVVQSASGRELACTPNHPILTDRGWLPANAIKVGCNVISDGGHEWKGSADVNNENVPAFIEDVVKSFARTREVAASMVPVAAPDFHGDGAASKVAVIWTNRYLGQAYYAARFKHSLDCSFKRRCEAFWRFLSRLCSQAFFRECFAATTAGFVGCCRLLASLLFGHLRPFHGLGLALGSPLNITQLQDAFNRSPGYREPLGDGVLRLSSKIGLDDISGRQVNLPVDRGVVFAKNPEDDLVSYAELGGQIASGATGPVFADKVISVFVKKFSGHVYNLQTPGGYYSANGIIVKNCRCAYIPAGKPVTGNRLVANWDRRRQKHRLRLNFNPYHDEKGQFASGGHAVGASISHPADIGELGGHIFHSEALEHFAGPIGTVGTAMAAAKLYGGKVGAAVEHAEHVAKGYVADKVEAVVSKLPRPVQAAVRASYFAGRMGIKSSFAAYTASQSFAERVALERGFTAEQARQLRGRLATWDVLLAKPTSLAVSPMASFVPAGSASYLAYSTARDPAATYRAAKGVVRDTAAKLGIHLKPKEIKLPKEAERPRARLGVEELSRNVRSHIVANATEADRTKIADALEAHDFDDWYCALFDAALEDTEDIDKAIAVANAAYEENPTGNVYNPDQLRDTHGRFSAGGYFSQAERSLPKTARQPVNPHAGYAGIKDKALEANEQLKDLLNRGKGVGPEMGLRTLSIPIEEHPEELAKPGGIVLLAPIKGEARATQKVNADYNGNWSKIGDMTRASVVVDNDQQLREVIGKLREHGAELAKAPKNKMTYPTAVGYRDIQLSLKMKNGINAEVQLHLKPIMEAKGEGHKYYETMRDIDAKLKMEKRHMTGDEQSRYKDAFDRSYALYSAAWKKATS
jgi:SPP1 gp7 family putative phage head morphogenesis protein